jgi:hypothetical protein
LEQILQEGEDVPPSQFPPVNPYTVWTFYFLFFYYNVSALTKGGTFAISDPHMLHQKVKNKSLGYKPPSTIPELL